MKTEGHEVFAALIVTRRVVLPYPAVVYHTLPYLVCVPFVGCCRPSVCKHGGTGKRV